MHTTNVLFYYYSLNNIIGLVPPYALSEQSCITLTKLWWNYIVDLDNNWAEHTATFPFISHDRPPSGCR